MDGIYWTKGKKGDKPNVPVTHTSISRGVFLIVITFIGIFLFAQFLIHIPDFFSGMEPAALPYWDSTTSILSVTAMWLTARKKIDNWYYWFAVDVLATCIYLHKELYFYAFLYFLYIGMAIAGYLAWRKTMSTETHTTI